MTKQTQFTKHGVRIEKGLSLGAELDEGMILVTDWQATAIKEGSVGTGLSADNWTTWNLRKLAEALGGHMPQDAYGAVLDVAVNDSGAGAGVASLGFAAPSQPGLTGGIVDGKTQYVYCPPANDRVGSRTVTVRISKDGLVAVKSGATGANRLDYSVKLIGWLVGGTDSEAIELPYVDLKAKLTVNHP